MRSLIAAQQLSVTITDSEGCCLNLGLHNRLPKVATLVVVKPLSNLSHLQILGQYCSVAAITFSGIVNDILSRDIIGKDDLVCVGHFRDIKSATISSPDWLSASSALVGE